jgi:hypothetical protein
MNELATPEKEVTTALEQAKAFTINSPEDRQMVDAHCAGLLALKKKIEADFAEPKAATYAAWKAVVAQEKGHLDGVDDARKIDKAKLAAWDEKVEAERLAEEARLQAIAKAQAEKDAIDRAVAMEAAGQQDEAEAIISEPVATPTVIVPKVAVKSQTTIRKVWKYKVTNAALVPREYLALDDKKIGGVVRALGGATNIPGIQAFQESC